MASGSQPNVTIEKALVARINPSINETSKATIECALYVPPGEIIVYGLSSELPLYHV